MENKIKGIQKVMWAINREIKPKGICMTFKIIKKPTPKIKSGKIIRNDGMSKKF